MVYKSCIFLDEENFDGYLGLCSKDFSYTVHVYSPELGKEMVWLSNDRNELASLFENVRNHVRLDGKFFRQATVYSVDRDVQSRSANVLTSVTVIHTDAGGASRIFAVARYQDTLDLSGDLPLLKYRRVRLDTRELGTGSHIPM